MTTQTTDHPTATTHAEKKSWTIAMYLESGAWVDKDEAEAKIAAAEKRGREEVVKEIIEDYGNWNNGCYCCADQELGDALREDYLTSTQQEKGGRDV